MTDIHVSPKFLNEIKEIIKKNCPKAIVWAYGSRVDRTSHEGSDLDLVIKDYGQKNVNYLKLKEALQESNIPFLVDIIEFDGLSESFQAEIQKQYVVIYDGQSDK